MFERLAPTETRVNVLGFYEHLLRFCQSYALTAIGQTEAALEVQQRALELPQANTVDTSLLKMDRATCLISRGEREEGYQLAERTLAEFPIKSRAELVAQRARDILRLTQLVTTTPPPSCANFCTPVSFSASRTATSPPYRARPRRDTEGRHALPSLNKTLTCDGILFDNEGTLIDASAATQHCWRTSPPGTTCQADELLGLVPGRPARDLIGRYAEQLPVPVDEALHRYLDFASENHTGIRPIPGAAEVLDALPSDRWVVVTSGTRDFAMKRIAAAGLPTPPQLITADDVSAGKPSPPRTESPRNELAETHHGASPSTTHQPASPPRDGCQTLGLLTTHTREALPDADAYATDLSHVRIVIQGQTLEVALSY